VYSGQDISLQIHFKNTTSETKTLDVNNPFFDLGHGNIGTSFPSFQVILPSNLPSFWIYNTIEATGNNGISVFTSGTWQSFNSINGFHLNRVSGLAIEKSRVQVPYVCLLKAFPGVNNKIENGSVFS
jgi:hypothetical protein